MCCSLVGDLTRNTLNLLWTYSYYKHNSKRVSRSLTERIGLWMHFTCCITGKPFLTPVFRICFSSITLSNVSLLFFDIPCLSNHNIRGRPQIFSTRNIIKDIVHKHLYDMYWEKCFLFRLLILMDIKMCFFTIRIYLLHKNIQKSNDFSEELFFAISFWFPVLYHGLSLLKHGGF